MYQLLCTMNRWISLLEIAVIEDSVYRVHMFTDQTSYQNIKTIEYTVLYMYNDNRGLCTMNILCTMYFMYWLLCTTYVQWIDKEV